MTVSKVVVMILILALSLFLLLIWNSCASAGDLFQEILVEEDVGVVEGDEVLVKVKVGDLRKALFIMDVYEVTVKRANVIVKDANRIWTELVWWREWMPWIMGTVGMTGVVLGIVVTP